MSRFISTLLINLPLVMAWTWAVLLILYPTWFFFSNRFSVRIQALIVISTWIYISCLYLKRWTSEFADWQFSKDSEAESSTPCIHIFYTMAAFITLFSLYAATYPLTSSGDEVYHARTFQVIGYGFEAVISRWLPGPSILWRIFSIVLISIIFIGFSRWIESLHHRFVSWTGISILIVISIGSAVIWLRAGDQWIGTLFTNYDSSLFSIPVRFPPLAKFLWLPASLMGWNSVFVLRIPAVVCWLLSGIILFQTVRLHNDSCMAIFPAIYLLALPGMFYYSHLATLTTPMLMLWCLALYFYERYHLFSDRRFLAVCVLALNLGIFLRRETVLFAICLGAHWLAKRISSDRSHIFDKKNLLDAIGILWFSLSPIIVWRTFSPFYPFPLYFQYMLDLKKVLSIANDFPFHVGPIITGFFIIALPVFIFKKKSFYSKSLLDVSIITIGVTYLLYTLLHLVEDVRGIGLFSFGREFQTGNRYLVSWSPFIALLISESITLVKNRKGRLTIGIGLVLVLFIQSTFWHAPLLLPEYTSLRPRVDAEFPHLPTKKVVEFVSDQIDSPTKKVLIQSQLAARYYTDFYPHKGIWVTDPIPSTKVGSVESFAEYCSKLGIDIVVLPLIRLHSLYSDLSVFQAILTDYRYRIIRIFKYLNQPAILVAEYSKNGF